MACVGDGNLPGDDIAQIRKLATKPLLMGIEHAPDHQFTPRVDQFDNHRSAESKV